MSTGALDVLKQAWERTGGQGLVFPGLKGKPLSNRTIQLLLQRLEIPHLRPSWFPCQHPGLDD